MKQTISTIPVADVFIEKSGCPLCRLKKKLEESYADYITGDAKMEPAVRIETNKAGFCTKHLKLMFERGGRLSNALILESHLQHIIDQCFSQDLKKAKDMIEPAEKFVKSCFICESIGKDMERAAQSAAKLFQKEETFRKLFAEQPFFCLDHYTALIKAGSRVLGKKDFLSFAAAAKKVALDYLSETKNDVTYFCSMFDYRNSGGDFKNSKDSIERAAMFLAHDSDCRK